MCKDQKKPKQNKKKGIKNSEQLLHCLGQKIPDVYKEQSTPLLQNVCSLTFYLWH